MITILAKTERLAGSLRVPGDKSIPHSALILGALARSEQIVEGLPDSEVVASTIRCLRQLGVVITERSPGCLHIGRGTRPNGKPGAGWIAANRRRATPIALDVGNSGSTTSLLAGLIAGVRLTASEGGTPSRSFLPTYASTTWSRSQLLSPLDRSGGPDIG